MGTLFIDRKELYIRLDGQALAFYVNDIREGAVPIKPLQRVVIAGNIIIDAAVLHRLADENISVLFLSGKRQQFKGILHGRLHKNGLLRIRQYQKSLTAFSLEMARQIVERKLTGQRDFLNYAMAERQDLRSVIFNAVEVLDKIIDSKFNIQDSRAKDEEINIELDTLRGYEGGAAAAYFKAYTSLFPESLNFNGRNKRPPTDPVNAMLSLTYTLLHFEMVREIETIGLDPVIGFYHQFEYGREFLACDLIEPYRPQVDKWIWEIFRKRIFTNRDFAEGDERPGCYLKKNSRGEFYKLYEEWMANIRPIIVKDVQDLARRIMDGAEPYSEQKPLSIREEGDDSKEGRPLPLDKGER